MGVGAHAVSVINKSILLFNSKQQSSILLLTVVQQNDNWSIVVPIPATACQIFSPGFGLAGCASIKLLLLITAIKNKVFLKKDIFLFILPSSYISLFKYKFICKVISKEKSPPRGLFLRTFFGKISKFMGKLYPSMMAQLPDIH
jgi:hypothetical protein